jgi:hypothetical protein
VSLFDWVADLPFRIDDYSFETQERQTSSGFTRATTVVTLVGGGGSRNGIGSRG